VCYISETQKEFMLKLLGGSQGYVSFHAKGDDTFYLETAEDIEKYKQAKGKGNREFLSTKSYPS